MSGTTERSSSLFRWRYLQKYPFLVCIFNAFALFSPCFLNAYIVRELGNEFKYYIEVNFEKNTEVKSFFELNLDPERISTSLSAYFRIPIIEGETLLFFDEIQSCSKAIKALRFFYESKPDLHVIAAGSLLEFALSDLTSWGVGRIRSLYMYPMSFDEFLSANNEDELLAIKKEASSDFPLAKPFHEKLKEYLRYFLIIGGMPELCNF